MNFAKSALIGALSASAFALLTVPAFAQNGASVIQGSSQNSTQIGEGNTDVQGSVINGAVIQNGDSYDPSVNAASLQQFNQQNSLQYGEGNTSVQGSVINGEIIQDASGYYGGTNVNGATMQQFGLQNSNQLGEYNTGVQGSVIDGSILQQ
jgi:hypothetical protein